MSGEQSGTDRTDDGQDGYVEDTSADGVVRLTWHPGTPPHGAQSDGDD